MNKQINIIDLIKETDISIATPTRLSAIGGILRSLEWEEGIASLLLNMIRNELTNRLIAADSASDQEALIDTLIHISRGKNIFSDDCSDNDYHRLKNKQSNVERKWSNHSLMFKTPDVLTGTDPGLMQRLLILRHFYFDNLSKLSCGDDHLAEKMLYRARIMFDICRDDIFERKEYDQESLFLYYHVLCQCRPGHRDPTNTPYYKEYFKLYNLFVSDINPACDNDWQAIETHMHYRQLRLLTIDRSILPGIWTIDPLSCQRFRLQCYSWLLDLDPDSDGSEQEYHARIRFIEEVANRIIDWLDTKHLTSRRISTDQEARALLTLSLIKKITGPSQRLSQLLDDCCPVIDHLRPSRLRTHLMLHTAADLYDSEMFNEAISEISSWEPNTLTDEDIMLRSMQEELVATI